MIRLHNYCNKNLKTFIQILSRNIPSPQYVIITICDNKQKKIKEKRKIGISAGTEPDILMGGGQIIFFLSRG